MFMQNKEIKNKKRKKYTIFVVSEHIYSHCHTLQLTKTAKHTKY